MIVEEHHNSTRTAEAMHDSDFELQEALRNFQSYVDILREWDEKERAKNEHQSTHRHDVIDGELENMVESTLERTQHETQSGRIHTSLD